LVVRGLHGEEVGSVGTPAESSVDTGREKWLGLDKENLTSLSSLLASVRDDVESTRIIYHRQNGFGGMELDQLHVVGAEDGRVVDLPTELRHLEQSIFP